MLLSDEKKDPILNKLIWKMAYFHPICIALRRRKYHFRKREEEENGGNVLYYTPVPVRWTCSSMYQFMNEDLPAEWFPRKN